MNIQISKMKMNAKKIFTTFICFFKRYEVVRFAPLMGRKGIGKILYVTYFQILQTCLDRIQQVDRLWGRVIIPQESVVEPKWQRHPLASSVYSQRPRDFV